MLIENELPRVLLLDSSKIQHNVRKVVEKDLGYFVLSPQTNEDATVRVQSFQPHVALVGADEENTVSLNHIDYISKQNVPVIIYSSRDEKEVIDELGISEEQILVFVPFNDFDNGVSPERRLKVLTSKAMNRINTKDYGEEKDKKEIVLDEDVTLSYTRNTYNNEKRILVSSDGKDTILPPLECQFLEELLKNRGKVLSYDFIRLKLGLSSLDTVYLHVSRLRSALKTNQNAVKDYIVKGRGGYILLNEESLKLWNLKNKLIQVGNMIVDFSSGKYIKDGTESVLPNLILRSLFVLSHSDHALTPEGFDYRYSSGIHGEVARGKVVLTNLMNFLNENSSFIQKTQNGAYRLIYSTLEKNHSK